MRCLLAEPCAGKCPRSHVPDPWSGLSWSLFAFLDLKQWFPEYSLFPSPASGILFQERRTLSTCSTSVYVYPSWITLFYLSFKKFKIGLGIFVMYLYLEKRTFFFTQQLLAQKDVLGKEEGSHGCGTGSRCPVLIAWLCLRHALWNQGALVLVFPSRSRSDWKFLMMSFSGIF